MGNAVVEGTFIKFRLEIEMVTYTHRVKRSYRLSQPLNPHLSDRRPFDCHCQPGSPRIICPRCLSQLSIPLRCSVPVTWVRINARADDCGLVDMIGGSDPRQDIDLLDAWNIPRSNFRCEGIKAIEQYVTLSRKDAQQIAKVIRRYLVLPCLNVLDETGRIGEVERDPDDDPDWSHGSKRVLIQGEMAQTSLPRLEQGLAYHLTVYWIEETPSFPAKFEVLAKAPYGTWFPEQQKDMVVKAASQFLEGMCQAAGVEPVVKAAKMLGDVTAVNGRGRKHAQDAVRRAAGLADGVDSGWRGYPSLRRETLVAAMCSCVGKPLSQNTLSELLNGADGKKAFARSPRPFRYEWLPPTPMMARMQRTLSMAWRMRAEEGDAMDLPDGEQAVDDAEVAFG